MRAGRGASRYILRCFCSDPAAVKSIASTRPTLFKTRALRLPCEPPPRPRGQPTAPWPLHPQPLPKLPRSLLHTTSRSMASDEDYQSFLDKANLDPGTGTSTPSSRPVQSKAVNTDVPKQLLDVKETYTSESDEPFEPVSLKWKKGRVPTDDEFAELIDSNGEVAEIPQSEFDPQGQYKSVIKAVEDAGNGETSIFKTQATKTRVEYFVVSLDKKEHRIIGFKAVSIES